MKLNMLKNDCGWTNDKGGTDCSREKNTCNWFRVERQRKVNKWKQYITVSYLNQIILHVRLTAALRSFTVAWRCSSWNSNSDPLLVLRLLCLCCATRSCAFCEWVRTWKDFDNDVMNNGKKKSLSFGKSFSSGRLCVGLIRVYCVYLTCVSR